MIAQVTFRPLDTKDFELTYNWAHNNERVKWSFTKRPPRLSEHFEYMLDSFRCPLFQIAEVNGQPVGYVRVNYDNEISVYVAPEYRRQGIGTQLIHFAQTKFDYLYAFVLVGNQRSLSLFKKCGFERINRLMRFKEKCHILVWRSSSCGKTS